MREILFRGKRIDNAEWVYGSLVSLDDKGKAILKSKSAVYMPNGKNTISSTDCYEVAPETVGQYTGFKDKNGRKIFEGDIISFHQFLFDGSEYEKEILASIEYMDDIMCFGLNLLEAEEIKRYMGYDINSNDKVVVPFNDFYGSHEESCEVIGNKFDDGLSGYKMKVPKQFEFSDNDYLQNIKLLNDMIYGEVGENQ